jgi:8-oxo-dGTP pyrophosphatase MutT (NUDIX family)
LTRQFRYMYGQESIEVISGAVDEGERPLEAARRETLEEAGIVAEASRELGEVRFDTSKMAAPVHLFLAQGLTMAEPKPDSTGQIEILRISLDEALELAMEGTIVHGASVALLFKARGMLEREDQESAR